MPRRRSLHSLGRFAALLFTLGCFGLPGAAGALSIDLVVPKGVTQVDTHGIDQQSRSSPNVSFSGFTVEATSTMAGATEVTLHDFSVLPTSGFPNWDFTFDKPENLDEFGDPDPQLVGLPLDSIGMNDPNRGASSFDLTLWIFGDGHVLSETRLARATVWPTLSNSPPANQIFLFDFFLTTDPGGTAGYNPALPTHCVDVRDNSGLDGQDLHPIDFQPSYLGGKAFDANISGEAFLTAVACPRSDGAGDVETFGGSATRLDEYAAVVNFAITPEPGTSMLLASGLAGLAWIGRRRNR